MLSSAVFITHRCQALLPRGLAALRSGRVAGVCWVDSDRRLAFFALRENGLCCSAFPCLSRACLGKMIIYIYIWLKHSVFAHHPGDRPGIRRAIERDHRAGRKLSPELTAVWSIQREWIEPAGVAAWLCTADKCRTNRLAKRP